MDYLERSGSCYKYSAASDSWLEYVNSIGDHSLITSAFLDPNPFLPKRVSLCRVLLFNLSHPMRTS